MLNLLLADAKQADWTSYLMIGVLIVAIIGLFVWSSVSNKKKQKQAQEMVNGIQIGDKVKTIGGVCGYVAEINDSENTFVLRTGMNGKESFVKFDKGAIYQTAPAKPREEKKEEPAEKKPAKKTSKKAKAVEEVKEVKEVKEETSAE